jgi:hypothetical protein
LFATAANLDSLSYVIRPDGTTMLQALSLSKLTGIRHGFFDRSGGVPPGFEH